MQSQLLHLKDALQDAPQLLAVYQDFSMRVGFAN